MLENIDDEAKRRDEKNWRWSARTDSARLLACMFGTLEMRQSFVMAKQPLTKQQLDSRLDETPSQKYWTTVTQLFSDPEHRVHVGVKDAVVTSYLQVQKKKCVKKFCIEKFLIPKILYRRTPWTETTAVPTSPPICRDSTRRCARTTSPPPRWPGGAGQGKGILTFTLDSATTTL